MIKRPIYTFLQCAVLLFAWGVPNSLYAMTATQLQLLTSIEKKYKKSANSGQGAEALLWAQQGYDITAQEKDDKLRMVFARYLGNAALAIGNFSRAHNMYSIEKELSVRFEDAYLIWHSMNGLGIVSWRQKCFEGAISWYKKAIKQAQKMGSDSNRNISKVNMALVYKDMGLVVKAEKSFKDGLMFYRKHGNKSGEATTLNSIGNLHIKEKPNLAVVKFQQALSIYRELEDKSGVAMSLSNIGVALSNTGKDREALGYKKQALQLDKENGAKYSEWFDSKSIAYTLHRLSRNKEAAEYQAHADFLKHEGGF